MRHRMRGRKLGRNASHRKAMFRNMACSLIKSIEIDEDAENAPRVAGRIVTTLPKAKELRPFVEKLITLARKAIPYEERAEEFETDAERGSTEYVEWRKSDQWQKWNQAIAPAVALRRRAFAVLRDAEAVDILFSELADRYEDRPGGYTRVVRLPNVRLGDSGQQAFIEFVGEGDRDRKKAKRKAPVVTDDEPETDETAADESAETQDSVDDADSVDSETAEAESTESATAAGDDTGDEEDEKNE